MSLTSEMDTSGSRFGILWNDSKWWVLEFVVGLLPGMGSDAHCTSYQSKEHSLVGALRIITWVSVRVGGMLCCFASHSKMSWASPTTGAAVISANRWQKRSLSATHVCISTDLKLRDFKWCLFSLPKGFLPPSPLLYHVIPSNSGRCYFWDAGGV